MLKLGPGPVELVKQQQNGHLVTPQSETDTIQQPISCNMLSREACGDSIVPLPAAALMYACAAR